MSAASWREYNLSGVVQQGTGLRRKGSAMRHSRSLAAGITLAAAIGILGAGQAVLQGAQGPGVEAPAFEVDPLWPKPLPNHWILGSTIGVGVDSRDHVFIIHRGYPTLTARTEAGLDTKPQTGERCGAAPPILEFDPEGNLVKAWGGPEARHDSPESNHGISIDNKDNVWIGGNGTCPNVDSLASADCPRGTIDSFILKF